MLSAVHTDRAPRPGDEDVHALYGLVRDHTLAVLGTVDYTVDEARDQLTEPGFDPERDGRFVHDADGRLVGAGLAYRRGDGGQVEVDVVALDDAVRGWLVGWVLDRAREIGRRDGHREVTADHGSYRDDLALRATLAEHGFRVATTFHRMRIDHPGPVAVPAPPDGVVLRVAGDDEEVRRAAHHVLQSAFADHFGFAPETYGHWVEHHERKPVFSWSQLWVAQVAGRPVGVLECDDRFAEEEGCGYVASLGVLAGARGRGIAKHLLRHAFAVDAAEGRKGTLLHVDTDNVTPALGLYESVGMRPVLVLDAWRTVVAT